MYLERYSQVGLAASEKVLRPGVFRYSEEVPLAGPECGDGERAGHGVREQGGVRLCKAFCPPTAVRMWLLFCGRHPPGLGGALNGNQRPLVVMRGTDGRGRNPD